MKANLLPRLKKNPVEINGIDFFHPTTVVEFVNPIDFLKKIKRKRAAIKGARFVPPKIGSKGMGKVKIYYK